MKEHLFPFSRFCGVFVASSLPARPRGAFSATCSSSGEREGDKANAAWTRNRAPEMTNELSSALRWRPHPFFSFLSSLAPPPSFKKKPGPLPSLLRRRGRAPGLHLRRRRPRLGRPGPTSHLGRGQEGARLAALRAGRGRREARRQGHGGRQGARLRRRGRQRRPRRALCAQERVLGPQASRP